jgi:hypothetical protein
MDALVIGPAQGLAGCVTRALRRKGRAVLHAIPSDADGDERIDWLLGEAGRPRLVVVFDGAPYAIAHALLGHTQADVVLVDEHRAAIAAARAVPRSYAAAPIGRGLEVVTLIRSGRRWCHVGASPAETLSAERAAAVVVRACSPTLSAVVP